jgi:large subunit ribosomal protein L25
LNEDVAPGVKLEGGVVSHIMVDVDISCLPKDLPTYIEVDLVNLSIGDSIHLSEIKAPEGVELTALSEENDPIITSVSKPKVVVEETPVAAEVEEGEEGAEAAEGGDDKAAEGGDDKAAEGGDEKSDKKD